MNYLDFERWVEKIQFTDTCWLWTAAQNQKGYGLFKYDGGMKAAHKFSYQWFVCDSVAGELSHNTGCPKNCVNPDHLEDLSPKDHKVKDFQYRPGMTCKSGRHLMATWDDIRINDAGQRKCLQCYQIAYLSSRR